MLKFIHINISSLDGGLGFRVHPGVAYELLRPDVRASTD